MATQTIDDRLAIIETTLRIQDATGTSHLQQLEMDPAAYGVAKSSHPHVKSLRLQRNRALHGEHRSSLTRSVPMKDCRLPEEPPEKTHRRYQEPIDDSLVTHEHPEEHRTNKLSTKPPDNTNTGFQVPIDNSIGDFPVQDYGEETVECTSRKHPCLDLRPGSTTRRGRSKVRGHPTSAEIDERIASLELRMKLSGSDDSVSHKETLGMVKERQQLRKFRAKASQAEPRGEER